ncbi:MAG: hypothetical protein HYV96_18800 [Opitutae bacterium]|nr:hypothetical protein [Opitutae bacterium]
MKTRLLLLVILALGFVQLSAQTARPAAPGKADAKKDAEPKIDGITIARPNGKFLGLALEGGTFKLSFYDEKKKPARPDVMRAAARWNPNYKQGSERVVLNPSADGKALVGTKPVRPPYAFKLYLTLLAPASTPGSESGEQATESYVVDFRA